MNRPPSIVFDSSMYVAALRQAGAQTLSLRSIAGAGFVWMSAVVLAELYAGAKERHSLHTIERLERDFSSARRILTPSTRDWIQTGRVLARLAAKYDYETVGIARITNDVLIAVSAGRNGATVVTLNARDFARIAEFTPFAWREQRP